MALAGVLAGLEVLEGPVHRATVAEVENNGNDDFAPVDLVVAFVDEAG